MQGTKEQASQSQTEVGYKVQLKDLPHSRQETYSEMFKHLEKLVQAMLKYSPP